MTDTPASTAAAGESAATGGGRRSLLAAVPFGDLRFWVIQMLVLAIDIGHLMLEDLGFLGGESGLYLLSVSIFLIPVVYAALSFGLRGALPTALWALLLSIPEITMHDAVTRTGILIQFGILTSIAVIVAVRVDREREAALASDKARRRLARLSATAAAAADSLDLQHVLRGSLRAKLDPRKRQVCWVRLIAAGGSEEVTVIDASRGGVPQLLTPEQEGLTVAACLTGDPQPAAAGPNGGNHTLVVPLRVQDGVIGALGVTQPDEAMTADESRVHGSIAHQIEVALANIRNHKRTRDALTALSTAKQNLETYIELATEAQEEERKRLSRELHDDILQSIAVATGRIDSVAAAGLPEETGSRLLDIHKILTDAMANLRRYCRDLRPSLLDDLGLAEAIDWLVGDLGRRTGMDVDLIVEGTLQRLKGRDELLVFRIVQEALHNVERHSEASEARVWLIFSEHHLRAAVTDNGRGMAPPDRDGDERFGAGLGIRGMDERTKLLRGRLTFTSTRGQGTTLILTVPLRERAPAAGAPA